MSSRERLGDHVAITTGFPFSSRQYTEDLNAIRLLRGDNVAQGWLRWSGAKRWPSQLAVDSERYALHAGDVVLAMDRPWIEAGLKYATIRAEDTPSLLVQRVARLRATNALDQSFLKYLIASPDFTAYVRSVQTGTGIPHISAAQISDYQFRLPPLREQQIIAEVLGALDEKIVINERIQDTALGLAKARYSAVPTQENTTISEVAEIFDGPHATPQKTAEGPWFLSISSLKGGVLDLSESAHLSEDDFPRWTKRIQPQAGDVLFSYETRLGEAALMTSGIRASLGRRMALLRPKREDAGGALLLHAYLSSTFQSEIQKRAVHGATVDRIPLKELPSWPVILPSREDRPALSETLNALHSTIEHTSVENKTLADLRDILLPQLVTGKIRIKDAERAIEEAV
ncbi:hypothetical protein CTU88_21455 [Streptomyces sp. JV178]|uniref:restriction endonuclease subunit S n=1 Tax=Streptomyces sp. JV178 TaxID=858632 RepID=UPI000C1B1606|nr:restriction endonuclease subunit S [Streptomyces sp. JV178]PIM71045.1 hypothetical protein CTU88_21455 [Streptomyces sp. JV178]